MEVAANEGLIGNPSVGGGGLAGSPSARAWLFARYQPQPGLIFAVASSSEPIIYAIALLSGEIAPFSRGKFRGGFGAVGEELRGCSKTRMLRCRGAKSGCRRGTSGGRVSGGRWGSVGGWSRPDRKEPPPVGVDLSAGGRTRPPIGLSLCRRRSFHRSSLRPARVLRAHHGLRSRIPG